MKRVMLILIILILLLYSTACNFHQKQGSKSQNSSTYYNHQLNQTNNKKQPADVIRNESLEVLSLIKAKNMKKLSQFIHPKKGVRFSPYGHVATDTDLVFSSSKIKKLLSDKVKHLWGSYDGSGQPIKLTFANYYKRFVYDKDFINAKDVGYNKILGKGNIINNSFKVYPKSIIVEYHFPGSDKSGSMDWKSLRLVFEKDNGIWYLVGIIHDEWTI